MGINSSNNLAQKWQDWTVSIGKAPYAQHEDFRINPKGNTDVKVFMDELKKLSDDFIKQYDTDKDGMISYSEFEVFEETQLKENLPNADEGLLAAAKESLKRMFNHLNVDNDSNSKEKLDTREIMNYFHTMDAFNSDKMVDGTVTPREYRLFTKWLGEQHTQEADHSDLVDMYLQANFEVYRNFNK